MGLRFRKTISLLPGVRLNVSKSGVGISAGVPGLRGSINTSGRVTGTASIPGTGLSYVKTKQLGSKSKKSKSTKTAKGSKSTDTKEKKNLKESAAPKSKKTMSAQASSIQIDENTIKSIHSVSDTANNWEKLAESDSPAAFTYDETTWEYLHSTAPLILKGDIDAYLQVIADVNPLDDLLCYGSDFQFGTDSSSKMEVEFVINDAALSDAASRLSDREYNLLLQDFVCSVTLRTARDIFALLPVEHTIVHVVLRDTDIFSVDYNRDTMAKINFDYIDASNTATKFRHNMSFDEKKGFSPVNRL